VTFAEVGVFLKRSGGSPVLSSEVAEEVDVKRNWTTGMAAVLVVVLTGWKGRASQEQSQQAPPATAAQAPKEPSTQEINDAFVQQISKQIAGHEQEPAGQVFKNVQVLKKTPASRFLLIMNLGYSKGLGVTCEHCHVKEDFSKDDKRPKRCARDMQQMHGDINQQLVKMQNLAPNPNGHFINCSTCHRGQIDPMANQD
jgi:Photosynthetic reaction centre cytochrome C subunit